MATKSDLFAGNKPVGHVSRNGFDGSAARVFTMRPAIIRPVFYQHTVPDSSYKINATDIVRATSLQTAAFLRGRQELDFYFVPYSQIQTNALDIILQRGDRNTLGAQLPNKIRKVNLAYLFYWAGIPFVYSYMYKFLEVKNPNTKWQNLKTMWEVWVNNGSSITQDQEYRMTDLMFYNPQLQEDLDVSGCLIGSDVLNLLATLGYGDKSHELSLIMETFIQNYADATQDSISDIMRNLRDVFMAWVEDIDVSSSFTFTQTDYDANMRSVNLLALMSYQHIWRTMYRDSVNDDNTIYEFAETSDYVIQQFSLYDYFGSGYQSMCPLYTFLRPRQRMYKRDLSTGLYASPQYGNEGSLDIDSVRITNDISTPGTGYVTAATGDSGSASPNGLFSGTYARDKWTISNAVQAYDIKYALALQKYREMLLRAGNRTKDVLKAEFGVESRYVDDIYPHYIGSFSGSLDLNKVAATADTGDYQVGELAGNVFSSLNGNELNFTCNDYGIIIGVLSFITDPLHNAFGIDALNIKTEGNDFYHEAFANLGLQPVSSERFSLIDSTGSKTPYVLGYAARDIEYKQNTDFVYDNFCTSPFFGSKIAAVFQQLSGLTRPVLHDGANTNYVSVKNLAQTLSMLKERTYLLPNCMDSVFKALDGPFDENHHFEVALNIQMSEVLPMPVTGMM